MKNLNEQRNSRKEIAPRGLWVTPRFLFSAITTPRSELTQTMTLTNSKRCLWITAHHLSAVTSICPLVDSATLQHSWAGTYGQRECHMGSGYAAFAVVAFHLSHLLHLPHFVSSPYSLLPRVFRHITAQSAQFCGPHGLWPRIVGVRLVAVPHIDEQRQANTHSGPLTT